MYANRDIVLENVETKVPFAISSTRLATKSSIAVGNRYDANKKKIPLSF